jgi:hypothetical protein
MPYALKDLSNNDLYEYSVDIIDYFYSGMTNESLEKSTVYHLIDKYRPDLIIDAINSATVIGNAYDPEYWKGCFTTNPVDGCKKMMVDDCVTKMINFVCSLKYSMEKYGLKKYVKVSTTGLGGMGVNIPYTHGDNPKNILSSALLGKISAAGILHQLLWNLSHTNEFDISLIIPATFVGYDSAKKEPIETEKGRLKKRHSVEPYKLKLNADIKYNNNISNEYLEFPVVRAGENHVYSSLELKTLTAIGQMEAITKEEVAKKVVECIYGNSNKNIFASMDCSMLVPTYSGREMIHEVIKKIEKETYDVPGVATGNLGVKISKQLYELFLLKKAYPAIQELKNVNIETFVKKVNAQLDSKIVSEIITLGIPILTNNDELYIGDYTLMPSSKEQKILTTDNLNKWTKTGWVDLRKNNLDNWREILLKIYQSEKIVAGDDCILSSFSKINDDYDIAEYLAHFYNMENKGRKK